MLRPDQNNEMEDGEPSSGHHRDLSVVDFSNIPSFRRVEAKTGDALRKCSTKSVPFGAVSCTDAVDADAAAFEFETENENDAEGEKTRKIFCASLRQQSVVHSDGQPVPRCQEERDQQRWRWRRQRRRRRRQWRCWSTRSWTIGHWPGSEDFDSYKSGAEKDPKCFSIGFDAEDQVQRGFPETTGEATQQHDHRTPASSRTSRRPGRRL